MTPPAALDTAFDDILTVVLIGEEIWLGAVMLRRGEWVEAGIGIGDDGIGWRLADNLPTMGYPILKSPISRQHLESDMSGPLRTMLALKKKLNYLEVFIMWSGRMLAWWTMLMVLPLFSFVTVQLR